MINKTMDFTIRKYRQCSKFEGALRLIQKHIEILFNSNTKEPLFTLV